MNFNAPGAVNTTWCILLQTLDAAAAGAFAHAIKVATGGTTTATNTEDNDSTVRNNSLSPYHIRELDRARTRSRRGTRNINIDHSNSSGSKNESNNNNTTDNSHRITTSGELSKVQENFCQEHKGRKEGNEKANEQEEYSMTAVVDFNHTLTHQSAHPFHSNGYAVNSNNAGYSTAQGGASFSQYATLYLSPLFPMV